VARLGELYGRMRDGVESVSFTCADVDGYVLHAGLYLRHVGNTGYTLDASADQVLDAAPAVLATRPCPTRIAPSYAIPTMAPASLSVGCAMAAVPSMIKAPSVCPFSRTREPIHHRSS
jgi:hypothetical protein